MVVDFDYEADDRERYKRDKLYNIIVVFGTPLMIGFLVYLTIQGNKLGNHFDQDKYVEYPYMNVRKNVSSKRFIYFCVL